MESSPERRISAIVAIVGDDEALAGALERALRDRGATVVSISTDRLIDAAPPHDLALVVGSAALDGGEALFARLRSEDRKVAVVLNDTALAERLVAHKCGASVVLRKESAEAMVHDVARILKGEESSELGWTPVASIVELLRQSISARLSVDPGARTEVLLGDPEAVRELIESFADELGVLSLTSRAGATGPTVAVEDPSWDEDERETTQLSAKEVDAVRELAASVELTPFRRPPPLPPLPKDEVLEFDPPFGTKLDEKIVRAPIEPVSAPATHLADLLEPDYVEPSYAEPDYVVEIEVLRSDALLATDYELYDDEDFSDVTPVKSLAEILASERDSDRPTAIPPPMPELSKTPSPFPPPPPPPARIAAASHASSPSTPPPPIARHATASSPSDAPPPMTKHVPSSSPSDGPPPPRSQGRLSPWKTSTRQETPVAAPAEAPRAPWVGIANGAAAFVGLGLITVIAIALLDADDEPRDDDPPAVAVGESDDVAEPTVAEPAPTIEEGSDEEEARELARTPAIALEREGRWEEARAAWEAALAADPNDPHALAGLARERMHEGDAEGAIRFAERAANLRRRRAHYRVLLGDAHRLAGDEAEARSHYEAALMLEPGYPAAEARLAP